MLQFDTFTNPVPASRPAYPFVVCLQSGLFAAHRSQVVAPLALRSGVSLAENRLAPLVRIDAEEYVVLVPALVNLPARELTRRVANLARHREALLGAVDLLFYGT